ncbi:CRISPR-associated Cse1 family protein [Leucobacter luti]|uniref:CRISPR-associated Cse1 family protein n=1 Tax=Leucobacter luti TaxID=340320 RepID=A0A4R6RZH3_9MICO|nr:type I-E CRISPR-associated protein Cse1/CasA [Leucobacter luti]TDP92581.1 CRISPR-associated Cse1 family protein [Leucobacter luti]
MGTENEGLNLVRYPWIPCLIDGSTEELSILDVFRRANEIQEVVGELPTQTFAIVRLLEAILYRALDEDYESVQDWERMWPDGLPVEDIERYLAQWEHHFELFDPVQPFFQVAGLATAKGESKGVEQLIMDLPANNRHFTTRGGLATERLNPAEAARWLITLQAYDLSGIKSGALDDPRTKGGKGYPIGTGYSGHLGGILLEGSTLAETLLLNLVAPDMTGGFNAEDLPAWERPQLDKPESYADRVPTGPNDLYTWQSRRVRLWREGEWITGSLVANGLVLTPQNLHRIEPMTAWRRSKPQEAKLKRELVYMPKEHDPTRAFWRGLAALTPRLQPVRAGKDADPNQPPITIDWLRRLQDERVLPASTRIGLRAIGVQYGSQSSVVTEIVDDRLNVAVEVLREQSRPLAAAAEDAVARVEESVFAFGILAKHLDIAAGGEGDGAEQRARELAFHGLDSQYRAWLSKLGPESDVSAVYAAWKRLVREFLTAEADSLVQQSGPQAWQPREYRGAPMNATIAQAKFASMLNKSLGRLEDLEEAS